MSGPEFYCYCCGASLEALPLPLARLAECLSCRTELHVCRMCEFYDPAIAQSCREPMAEEVKDKTRANFCEFFVARPGKHPEMPGGRAEVPRQALDALFGDAGNEAEADDPPSALEDLFRRD